MYVNMKGILSVHPPGVEPATQPARPSDGAVLDLPGKALIWTEEWI